jgi:ABC-type Fe3+-hydroxamate transport system substrate-binding protein
MKILIFLFVSVITAVLLAGCGNSSSSQNQGTNATANTTGNNPADYLGGLVQAKKTADKTIDVAYLNQALSLFNVQEGRYPKTLAELRPKYVAMIPDAPIGYKLNYDAVKGEVKMVKQ